MSEMFSTLGRYFEMPTVRYALIVGLLIALCSSLLGVTLVMKRFSFIGDGLSHVAFGAMAVATITGVTNNMLIIMPVTVCSAVLLLRTGSNTKIKGDAAIAMISVGALALGYMLMNIASQSGSGRTSGNVTADVCSTLFGSTAILTLSIADVWICVGMSVIVIAVFLIFYNKIFAVTFDESFAKATGIRSDLYNLLIAVVIAMIIVAADIGTDNLPCPVGNARIQELPQRYNLLGYNLPALCVLRHNNLNTCRNSRRLDHSFGRYHRFLHILSYIIHTKERKINEKACSCFLPVCSPFLRLRQHSEKCGKLRGYRKKLFR